MSVYHTAAAHATKAQDELWYAEGLEGLPKDLRWEITSVKLDVERLRRKLADLAETERLTEQAQEWARS